MLKLFCILLLFFNLSGILTPGPDSAFGADFQLTTIDQIYTDADGQALRFPSTLFFDKNAEEIYLATSAKQQVIIYTKDFYPLIAFSSGRGIYRPRGIFIDNNNMIYVCQDPGEGRPARISVLNGAFMMVREISLDHIPEVPDFIPHSLVVNSEGIIYVTSRNHRGVAVLDNDGVFLRWLKPIDTILYKWNIEDEADARGQETEHDDIVGAPSENVSELEIGPEIPEEFMPKIGEGEFVAEKTTGPVMILSISTDSNGRLYLLSNETSKTYVYSPEETFLFSFGEKGGVPRTLSNPQNLAIDDDHRLIYVVDYMRHSILAYDQDDGKYLFEFGGKGKTPGYFNFPVDVAVNKDGQVLVADFFNHRIQVLDVKFQRELSFNQQAAQSSEPQTASDQPEESLLNQELSGPLIVEQLAAEDSELQGTEENKLEEISSEQRDVTDNAEPIPSQASEMQMPGTEEKTETATTDAGASITHREEPDSAALTPDLADIEPFITSWIKAWEQQDIEAYLSHYARNYLTPGGISLAEWEIERLKNLSRPKYITIQVSDVQIEKLDESQAQATFIQKYHSDIFTDEVVKTLDLIWEDLSWKILKETSETF